MADIETINDMKDSEKLDAIEDRAAMIASQISSATDPSVIRSLGDSAKALMAMIPQGNSRSGTVSSRVASVISEATNREASESDIDEASPMTGSRGPRGRMSMEFQQAIYKQMSAEEKAYYDKFQAGTQYKMATINEDGTITEKMVDGKQAPPVDGAQLKEDFARVKSYTLTEEQQATLTTPDGKKMAAMTPEEEIKELDKLKQSLGNIEGQKAQELEDTGASPEEAKRVRGSFMMARARVDLIKQNIKDIKDAENPLAPRPESANQTRNALKMNRMSLKEEVRGALKSLTDRSDVEDRKREKDNEVENGTVTPNSTRAGSVRARDMDSQNVANKEILAASDDGESKDSRPLVTGMQNIADGTAVSPAGAGQKQQSAREL